MRLSFHATSHMRFTSQIMKNSATRLRTIDRRPDQTAKTADEAGDGRSDAGQSALEVVLDVADHDSSQLPPNVSRARASEHPHQPEQGGKVRHHHQEDECIAHG